MPIVCLLTTQPINQSSISHHTPEVVCTWKAAYHPKYYASVDESMVAFKRRLGYMWNLYGGNVNWHLA